MAKEKTKAELQAELDAKDKRIKELEEASAKKQNGLESPEGATIRVDSAPKLGVEKEHPRFVLNRRIEKRIGANREAAEARTKLDKEKPMAFRQP